MKISGFSKSETIPVDTLLNPLAMHPQEEYDTIDILYAITSKSTSPETARQLWMWYKVAVTNPLDLPGWNDDILVENKTTLLWDAATQFFGHRWNMKKVSIAIQPEHQPTTPNQKSDASSIDSNNTSYTNISDNTNTSSNKSKDNRSLKLLKHFVNKNFSRAIITPKRKSSAQETKFQICNGP